MLVAGTNSLSYEEWKKMYYYSLVIQSFHCLGLTRYIAIYMHYEYGMNYQEFYQNILEWCMDDSSTIAGKSFSKIINIFEAYLKGEMSLSYIDQRFGEVIWPLEEAWYLEIVYEKDIFYKELKTFFAFKYPNVALEDIGKQLFLYQEKITNIPGLEGCDIVLNYDFNTYFENIIAGNYQVIKRGIFKYHADIDYVITEWDSFAREIVWYGRKGGKNHLTLNLE